MDKATSKKEPLTPASIEVLTDPYVYSVTVVLPVELETEKEIISYIKKKVPSGFFNLTYWEIEGNFAYGTYSKYLDYAFVNKRKKG